MQIQLTANVERVDPPSGAWKPWGTMPLEMTFNRVEKTLFGDLEMALFACLMKRMAPFGRYRVGEAEFNWSLTTVSEAESKFSLDLV